jgi:hypothetical protein
VRCRKTGPVAITACKLFTRATLSPGEKKSIEQKPTENLEAYDLYLRANELISNSIGNTSKSKHDLLEAVVFLEKAVRSDPNFALAYCASAYTNEPSILVVRPDARATGSSGCRGHRGFELAARSSGGSLGHGTVPLPRLSQLIWSASPVSDCEAWFTQQQCSNRFRSFYR